MIYAVSDLHGCYDKFMKLLGMIHLKEDDTLYVLGDIVDRGPENVALIREILSRSNVRALMGNHDYMAALMLQTDGMKALPAAGGNSDENADGKGDAQRKRPEARALFAAWLSDGGDTTWAEFAWLSEQERKVVMRYLRSLPVFEEIEVNGQVFRLSHTVPAREQMLDANRRVLTDFLFAHPEYDKVYFPDKILVTGHTPTGLIDPASAGRILRKNNHIAIDCGAVFGNPLGCICLDTGEEFYAE